MNEKGCRFPHETGVCAAFEFEECERPSKNGENAFLANFGYFYCVPTSEQDTWCALSVSSPHKTEKL